MATMAKAHPSEDSLERYSLGHLPEPECASLEEHLLVCASCQDRLAEVEVYIGDMKIACRAIEEQGSRRFGWIPPVSARAALCATFAGVVFLATTISTTPPPAPERAGVQTEISLRTTRGTNIANQASSDRAVRLKMDVSDLAGGSYRGEIVDRQGVRVWHGEVGRSGAQAFISVGRPLPPGTYWVRLVAGSDVALREYQLIIR